MSVAARNSTCVELHSAASYRIYMYLPYFQRQKLSETRQKLRGKSMISLGVLWGSQMSISRIAAADLQLGNSPSSPVSSNCWHVLSCLHDSHKLSIATLFAAKAPETKARWRSLWFWRSQLWVWVVLRRTSRKVSHLHQLAEIHIDPQRQGNAG